MHVSTRTRTAAFAAAALTALAAAGSASAATVEVDGGATTLELAPRTARALDELGVAVSPLSPAKSGRSGVSFPVSGGSVDPATGAGTIEHRGGLRLRAGSTRVDLRNFTVNAGSTNTIGVRVGRSNLHAFRISLSDAKVTRSGFQTIVSGVKVSLSRRGAAALNEAFGVRAFAGGLRIGTARVRVRPAELAFTGGNTALALDPGTAAALAGLNVSVAPAAPATANADGSVAFPITEGRVNAETLAGSVSHGGGLTLSSGSTSVTVSDFVIETAPSPRLTAALGSSRVDLLTLDLAGLQRSVDGREVTLGGVVARLTQGAADALNTAFGTTAFQGGLIIGTATVTAEGA